MIKLNRKLIVFICLSPFLAFVFFILAYFLVWSTFPQIFGYPESGFEYIITIDTRVLVSAVLLISIITIGGTLGIIILVYQRFKKNPITDF